MSDSYQKECFDLLNKNFNGTIPRWEDLPAIQLYMDQIVELINTSLEPWNVSGETLLTPSMVNNYVKMGLLAPPEKKKYSRRHLAYLIMICLLKQIMPISDIRIFIESQIKFKDCEELLNSFAQTYENDFMMSLENMRSIMQGFDGIEDENSFYSMMILKSASLAGAGRYIVENSVKKISANNDKSKDEAEKNPAST